MIVGSIVISITQSIVVSSLWLMMLHKKEGKHFSRVHICANIICVLFSLQEHRTIPFADWTAAVILKTHWSTAARVGSSIQIPVRAAAGCQTSFAGRRRHGQIFGRFERRTWVHVDAVGLAVADGSGESVFAVATLTAPFTRIHNVLKINKSSCAMKDFFWGFYLVLNFKLIFSPYLLFLLSILNFTHD